MLSLKLLYVITFLNLMCAENPVGNLPSVETFVPLAKLVIPLYSSDGKSLQVAANFSVLLSHAFNMTSNQTYVLALLPVLAAINYNKPKALRFETPRPDLSNLVYAKYHSHKYYHDGAPLVYKFKYGVKDLRTGDHKRQQELRDRENLVKGSYELIEPDGSKRQVRYSARDKEGFRAAILKEGAYIHPSGGRSFQNFNFHFK